jgi:hypothetical protein
MRKIFTCIFAITLIATFGFDSCGEKNGPDVADWVIALAKLPKVSALSFSHHISDDRKGVEFRAVLKNLGYDDAKGPFQIRMAVVATNVHLAPGQIPAQTITQENTITFPTGSTITGHHGTPGAGGQVSTEPIVGGMPYDPEATYQIFYVVDEAGSAFSGANSDVNRFTWTGKLK